MFIANAKSLGLTLREIRQIIIARSDGRLPCESVRTMLSDHVRKIDQQVARLQALRSDLRSLLTSYRKRPKRSAATRTVCPMIERLDRCHHRSRMEGNHHDQGRLAVSRLQPVSSSRD
ncbi:MAG: MerR family DNA-binding protein [bacterium]